MTVSVSGLVMAAAAATVPAASDGRQAYSFMALTAGGSAHLYTKKAPPLLRDRALHRATGRT